MSIRMVVVGLFALMAGMPGAIAQDEDSSISIEGYLGFLTDYRDRGLSLSDKDPTIVASVGAYHDGGLYGGVKAAVINDRRGADAQIKGFIGYSFDKDAYTYDFALEVDSIHGEGESRYYPELSASVARDFGIAYVRGGASWAMDGRWFTPEKDSLYAFADVEFPLPPMPEITLITHIGYDMREDRSDLMDWGVGFSAFIRSFEVSLMYEDSSINNPLGSGSVMVGLKAYF